MAILLGYRGSGKTTTGRILADRLWTDFLDTDAMVVKAAGRSIAEIFEADGEAAFRELEAAAVAEAVQREGAVIALGGGAVLAEGNRAQLTASGHSRVYLKCDPAELHRRIQADPATAASRPALTAAGGGLEEITALLAEREPLYRAVKTAELDVSRLSVEEAATYLGKMI
ncbi:MAG: shikimate kinase [Phycisphaerae bacterium]